jgi:hypothetical protein
MSMVRHFRYAVNEGVNRWFPPSNAGSLFFIARC